MGNENVHTGVSMRDLQALVLHAQEDLPTQIRIVGSVRSTKDGKPVFHFRAQACGPDWKPDDTVPWAGFDWPTQAHRTLTAALYDAVYRLSEHLEDQISRKRTSESAV